MKLVRGAVVTASINAPSGKPRPFLILRSDHFAGHRLVTVLAFTSTLVDAPTLRITIEPTAENGLRLPTQAMIDHIESMRVERVQLVVGRIAAADLRGDQPGAGDPSRFCRRDGTAGRNRLMMIAANQPRF